MPNVATLKRLAAINDPLVHWLRQIQMFVLCVQQNFQLADIHAWVKVLQHCTIAMQGAHVELHDLHVFQLKGAGDGITSAEGCCWGK